MPKCDLLNITNNRNNRKFLNPCLLVNRIWCKLTVSILWNNPYCLTNKTKNKLFNVILLHLSKESRENLKTQEIDLFIETHHQPLFDYINFWKHLDLDLLEDMIIRNIGKSKISIVKNEIMKLFVNGNTFTYKLM